MKVRPLVRIPEVDLGTWGYNPGTPISRLAVGMTPFGRMEFPGSPPRIAVLRPN